MIKSIIDMLQLDEFLGKSNAIDIAKGKYKIPSSIKEMYKQSRRELISKKKLNG